MTSEYVDRRGRSEQAGIVSRHCFSSGPYYDPELVSFGPIVGVDEHLVGPGAGFDWHAHRGVHIVSWVLEGTLRHEDSTGEVRLVPPGVLLVQSTGSGVLRHTETNASAAEPLRFLQITIRGEDEAGVRLARPPTTVAGVSVDIHGRFPRRFPAFVLVVRGEFSAQGVDPIRTGAFCLFERDPHLIYDNEGGALALVLELGN